MHTVKDLIDQAAALCSGLRQLSQRLDLPASYVSRVRNGKVPMSANMAGRLLEIIGDEHADELLQCLIDQEKDNKSRSALSRLFRVPATLAAALITSAALISPDISQAKTPATDDASAGFVSYVNFLRALRRYLGTLRRRRHRARLHHAAP